MPLSAMWSLQAREGRIRLQAAADLRVTSAPLPSPSMRKPQAISLESKTTNPRPQVIPEEPGHMGAHRMARQPGWEEVLFGAAFNHQVPATASQTWGTREHPGSIGSIGGAEPGSAPSVICRLTGLPLPQVQVSHTCECCDK